MSFFHDETVSVLLQLILIINVKTANNIFFLPNLNLKEGGVGKKNINMFYLLSISLRKL